MQTRSATLFGSAPYLAVPPATLDKSLSYLDIPKGANDRGQRRSDDAAFVLVRRAKAA